MTEPEPNILLMRLKSMGDVLFTLPAVHLLRETYPRARITFLVSAENAPLLEGFQEVDETIVLNRARYRSGNPLHILTETFTLLRRLRRSRFSLVVDFQGYGETAWLARLSGAPQRWASVHTTPRRWAYTRCFTCNYQVHPIEWYLSLLHLCGVQPGTVRNEFVLPDKALNEARSFFAAQGLAPDRPTLFIQPFTSTLRKNWPLEKYLVLAKHWRAARLQVIFGGGPGDHASLEPARQGGFVTSAGLSLLATAGLMELSNLVVGGVTGLLHLAVAMQKRVVMLIGYASRESGFPYRHHDWAVTVGGSSPAASISVESVIGATAQALVELGACPSAARP
jgi:heptosyltransferase-1